MSSSVEDIETGGREALDELLDDRPRLLDSVPGDRRTNGIAVRRLELGGQVDVDPLRLAHLLAEILEDAADLADLGAVRELERLEDRVLRHLVRPGLDHRQRLGGADDDEIERRLLELLERRVEDQLVLEPVRCGRRRSGRGTAAARSSARPRPR